jgi:hypothetical protein
VELASRVLMRLGGAPARVLEPSQLAPATPTAQNPFQRASELALRIGCIAEVFAGSTAAPIMRETTHPLLRSVYQTILRDEARHARFGSLYFEWAADRLDAAEQKRLGRAALDALQSYAHIWHRAEALPDARAEWQGFEVHELGWMKPSRYASLARDVVRRQILPALRSIGLELPEAELEALLV